MDNKNYERILNNVIKCAPLECGVQTLAFMLLDEIICSIENNELKVIVADLRDNNSIFGGEGGVLDLCIINNEFEYVKKLSNNEKDNMKFKKQKNNRLCCVEIKAPNNSVLSNKKQLLGHIKEYQRVLYSNGLVWMYLESKSTNTQSVCDSMDSFLKKSLNESIGVNGVNFEVGITGWAIPLAYDKEEKDAALSCTKKEIKIDKEKFDILVKKLTAVMKNLNLTTTK